MRLRTSQAFNGMPTKQRADVSISPSAIGNGLKYGRRKTHMFVDWRVGPGGGSICSELCAESGACE
jgi:hypothetical protein